MERQKFDDEWREAFKCAEVSPSDDLWTNIELDLEKDNGRQMRRTIVVLKWLAAASVVFGMCFGGLYVYQSSQTNTHLIAGKSSRIQGSSNQELKDASTDKQLSEANPKDVVSDHANLLENHAAGNNTKERSRLYKQHDSKDQGLSEGSKNPDRSFKGTTETYAIPQANHDRSSDPILLSGYPLPPIGTDMKVKLALPTKEVDPVALMLARLDEEEKKFSEDKEDKRDKKKRGEREQLWTSVGIAAGTFSSVTSGADQFSALQASDFSSAIVMNTNTATEQSNASGSSYSAGVSLGTKLAPRWVIQGGVNYLTQTSSYTTNSAVGTPDGFKAASIGEFNSLVASKSDAQIVNRSPYSVSNNLQYVSVPMQAGYLLVNQKFGVQLNAGLSTDLFLQNTVTPDDAALEKTKQGSGEDSPYRTLNLSGLFGTEFSYRFGTHYRVSVNPGVRYPFSSIYKSEIGIETMPFTFDVGLRLRYIFN